MKIDLHWQRFLKHFVIDFNRNRFYPKRFIGEFDDEDGIRRRVEIIVTQAPKMKRSKANE